MGKAGGGLWWRVVSDVRARLPLYASDFRDGAHRQVVATVLYLFFACLAPAVGFGGVLSVLTNGQIGATETILATAVCGAIYALCAGQPLLLIGSTGPVFAMIGMLYVWSTRAGVPFLPVFGWTGLWAAAILLAISATDSQIWLRWYTLFSDEIFAALISLIYLIEAGSAVWRLAQSGRPVKFVVLAIGLIAGTYLLAAFLSSLRKSQRLPAEAAAGIADFSPAVALWVMTSLSLLVPEGLDQLPVPESLAHLSRRSVNLFAAPVWVWFACALPGCFVGLLLFAGQVMTVRLVDQPSHQLRKPSGYNLDLFVLGVLTGLCSVAGLPWMAAATVRALNHVQSLSVRPANDASVITGVRENRLSGLAIHASIGLSLGFLGILGRIPMPVIFGLFVYMGLSSLRENRLLARWLVLLRVAKSPGPVPARSTLRYMLAQTAVLTALLLTMHSHWGFLFPLVIVSLPLFRAVLSRLISPEDLRVLDSADLSPHVAGSTADRRNVAL